MRTFLQKVTSATLALALVFSLWGGVLPERAEAGTGSSLIGSAVGCGTLPIVSWGVSQLVGLVNSLFGNKVSVKDSDVLAQQQTQSYVTNCLNGIAIGMAKLQLEKTTNKIVGWAQTGVNGNPLYVQDMNLLINSLEQSALQAETNFYKKESQAIQKTVCVQYESDSAYASQCSGLANEDRPSWCQDFEDNNFTPDPNVCLQYGKQSVPDYPYGRDFAVSQINLYKESQNLRNALRQDLTSYLVPGGSIQGFATDFSQGGWKGWIGLTQNEQNNPLGFSMIASEDIARKQEQLTKQKTEEVARNGGVQDQKKCDQWYHMADSDTYVVDSDGDPQIFTSGSDQTGIDSGNASQADLCVHFKTVTPGSIIKDEISATINSPTRQLELVRTLNESLIGFFMSLIDQFNSKDGLGGISIPVTNPFDDGLGISVSLDPNGNLVTTTNTSNNGPFDILHDLGNTYDKNGNITHRGILQIQQDYNEIISKATAILPNVLPTLGELDYCIPGPNPDWQTAANQEISTLISSANDPASAQYYTDVTNGLFPEYAAKIDNLYGPGSLMQTPTLSGGVANSSYLPMAASGLALTKNLPTYATTIPEKIKGYQSDASTTSANLYTLKTIKDKVNTIIKAAQKRRDADRKAQGLAPVSGSCLLDEQVTYTVNGVRK